MNEHLGVLPGLVALSAAVACGALLAGLLRAGSQVPRSSQRPRRRMPVVLWPAGRLGEIVGHAAIGLLPTPIASVWQLRLRQAELDQDVSVRQWLGARLIHGGLACFGAAIAARPWQGNDVPVLMLAGALGFWLPDIWLRDRAAVMRTAVLKELPAYLDLLTLAVEAGGSLGGAMRMAVEKAPPSLLRRAFERVLTDIRAGRSRMEALAATADHFRIAPLSAFVSALIQAESAGMSLGSILRAQSEQRLNERFAAAEKLALQAPVKMLGPLILCIFPCTFIVIGFPIVVRLMGGVST